MSSLDHACDAVDLVTAAVGAIRFVEHGVLLEYLVDRCASTFVVNLTEHVVEIAKQQGRCSFGHGFPQVRVVIALRCLDAGMALLWKGALRNVWAVTRLRSPRL